MNTKALVVIDIQNDITKHYRDIIDNINAAIDWAVSKGSISSIITSPQLHVPSSLVLVAKSWHQN